MLQASENSSWRSLRCENLDRVRVKSQDPQLGMPPCGIQDRLMPKVHSIKDTQRQAKITDHLGQLATMTINPHGRNEGRTCPTVNELSSPLFPQIRGNVEILPVFGNIRLFPVKSSFRCPFQEQLALSAALIFRSG